MLDFLLCHPRQKEGLVLRTLGEDAILYNPDTKKAHVLNKTSLLIWNLCTGDSNIEAIEHEVKSRFKAGDVSSVRSDIEETLTMLHAEGLVVLK